MTWFGGVCLVPIAPRTTPNTITNRVKEVNIRRMDGASVRMVKRKRISSVIAKSFGFCASPIPSSILSDSG